MSSDVTQYQHAGMSEHIQRQQGHHRGFQQDNDDLKTAHSAYGNAIQGSGGDAASTKLASYIAAHQEHTDNVGAYTNAIQQSHNAILQADGGVANLFT